MDIKNAQLDDPIEGNIGVGSSGSVLFLKGDEELNPRWDTGAHEAGHLMGLPDRSKGKSIMSYNINRNEPKSKDFSRIINQANLNLSITGQQIIEAKIYSVQYRLKIP